jgi:hypothetical protein
MATLTQSTPRDTRKGEYYSYPVAAATTIYAGAIVALNATGYAVNATDTAGQIVVGVADDEIINTGAAGDLFVRVRKGSFKLSNASAAQTIAIADVAKNCFVVDNDTVGVSSTNSVIVGKVVQLDADGVWVQII